MSDDRFFLAKVLNTNQDKILNDWLKEQSSSETLRLDLMSEAELRKQSSKFLNLFKQAVQEGNIDNIKAPEWDPVRDYLTTISRSRAEQGFTSSETAIFILSFKQPLFKFLEAEDGTTFNKYIWKITVILDRLALYAISEYQQSRETIISRQQRELLELSTPVVQLWNGIITLPLIGTLDSERTQTVMENLLQKIADTGSEIAIIDITGVTTVDTLVAQHLLKTVSAARLMGAECFISGISPQIAQTMVHLGVQLAEIVTKASLEDAFALALRRLGLTIVLTK